MRIERETAIQKEEDELKAEALKWKISIMKDKGWNEEGAAQSSGGAAQSSGGVLLTKMDFVRIINKRRPIPEKELRKAFEWKPWYERR